MQGRAHRGGWSTSICDLFSDPNRRSNCCALACCGLLLSDRNAHFMLDEQRPSWWKRFCWNIGVPVGLLLFLNILETFLATDDNKQTWDAAITLTLILVILILLFRARFERAKVRRAVMTKMWEMRGRDGGNGSVDPYLELHFHDIKMAHSTCSCYPKDIAYTHDSEGEGIDRTPPCDLCTCIWNSLKCLCCGGVFGCWFQMCGMCAIGQEDREIQLLLDKKQLQVDYITFQPYEDYYPKIQALRSTNDGSIIRHWSALSLLSYNLLKILLTSLFVLTIVALLNVDPKFQIQNLIVVLATFAQAFIVLYFCHWQWNRLDLSLDALIKYFASGFVLCTFLAMVYEMIVSSILGFISYMIIVIGISGDVNEAMTPEQMKEVVSDFAKAHVGLFAVFVFLNAFFVAAFVEEICKYFGYYMVETPDILDPNHLILDTISDDVQSDRQEDRTNSVVPQSKQSRAAAITVAMIAVASGFACSENLLYVFVYTPPGLSNEIATLVARSMFPIHPLCAAIQSIGVVRRDIEHFSAWQLGTILFPSIILHGAFDFVLMLLEFLEKANNPDSSSTENQKIDEWDDTDTLPLTISISMVIVGLIYYFCESFSQKKRLKDIDLAESMGNSSSVDVV
jgi:RsiW-degrading membrane proteinase PrsW (M82 family)